MDRLDAIRKAAEVQRQQREVLEARRRGDLALHDTQKPWRDDVEPTDRERELALRTMNAHNRGGFSHAELIVSISKALATYRVELVGKAQSPQLERTMQP